MTGEPLHGNWRNALGYRFLSAEDIEEGKEITLTVKQVTIEEAMDTKTSQKKQLVSVSFDETERLLALNKTNARTIASVTGSPRMEKWAGHKITLYRDKTLAFGKTVPCVRVRANR